MKKHETLSKGEELLAHVLDECLEEDLSFVPPEREIARTHRFSQRFEEAMRALLEKVDDHHRQREIRKHFNPRYGHLAACILVFCVCGGLFWYVIQPFSDKAATESAAPEAPAAAESAVEESAATEEPAEAEITDMKDTKEEAQAESGEMLAEEKVYCGQTVMLAAQQEVRNFGIM